METKRIGIDARLLSQTGVGVYTRNLLYELSKMSESDYEFFVYIRKEDEKDLPVLSGNFKLRYTNAQWHSFAEQTSFLQQLYSDNLDLMHFCYFSMPLLYNRKFVITIHDIIPYKYPTGKASTRNPLSYQIKHFMYKRVLAHGVTHSMKIFVPTEVVKGDIQNLFPWVTKEKIIKTYEGIDYLFTQTNPTKPKNFSDKPYFLYMGNYYPHKNVPFLLNAFKEAEIDAHIILNGPEDFFAKHIDALIESLGLSEKVIRMSNTPLSERVYLYTHALALVHPSIDEGFGLQLLEAQYFQSPAIVSDIPVLREIRPHASFFSLIDTTELVSLLRKTFQEKQRGSTDKIDAEFSFKKMAEETYNQYKQCI